MTTKVCPYSRSLAVMGSIIATFLQGGGSYRKAGTVQRLPEPSWQS